MLKQPVELILSQWQFLDRGLQQLLVNGRIAKFTAALHAELGLFANTRCATILTWCKVERAAISKIGSKQPRRRRAHKCMSVTLRKRLYGVGNRKALAKA